MNQNMNNEDHARRTVAPAVVAGLVVLLGTAGCHGSRHGDRPLAHGEAFAAEGTPRGVDKFAAMQIASGARADSTLYAYHFDNAQLNSAGREKLRYMLKDDDACEPLTVYVDAKGPGDAKARREAVTAFLLDEGLLESQIQVKEGTNPARTLSTAKGLKALADSDAGAAAADSGGGIGLGSATPGAPKK